MNHPQESGTSYFDDHGIRFAYPGDWQLDESEDGARTTVELHSPASAFALVTLDTDRPEPGEVADEVLTAMRQEYPDLEAVPARERIAGHNAVGHDLEFFSLDVVTTCSIRCYRTPSQTVLIFAQWSDLDGDDAEAEFRLLRRSIEDMESDDDAV